MVIFCLNIFTLKQVFCSFFLSFFFILITHSGNGAGEWRKDDFPQANLLQAFLAPQGTISPFTGKGKNTVTILSGIHLSACKVLTNKIKGSYPINQYQCINKFMSAFRKHALRMQGLAWPCITGEEHPIRRKQASRNSIALWV